VRSIKETGSTIEHKAKAYFGMQMEICLKVSSKTTSQMATEYTLVLMGRNTRVCGSTTYSTDRDLQAGRTGHHTQATTNKGRNTELERTSGPRETPTVGNGKTTKLMASVFTTGLTGDATKGTGRAT